MLHVSSSLENRQLSRIIYKQKYAKGLERYSALSACVLLSVCQNVLQIFPLLLLLE